MRPPRHRPPSGYSPPPNISLGTRGATLPAEWFAMVVRRSIAAGVFHDTHRSLPSLLVVILLGVLEISALRLDLDELEHVLLGLLDSGAFDRLGLAGILQVVLDDV